MEMQLLCALACGWLVGWLVLLVFGRERDVCLAQKSIIFPGCIPYVS